MRIGTIKVPKGCDTIHVEMKEFGKLTFIYESSEKEFLCEETGEMEEKAGMGDFAILWVKNGRDSAVVANVVRYGQNGEVFGSDGWTYEKAIKFRNYEQFLKVRGKYGEDEP